MVVPKGKTFLLKSIEFSGPCVTRNIVVQISGTIVGPLTLKEWGWPNFINKWIVFKNVDGLTVQGRGIIDGRGNCWWENSCHNSKHRNRPGCSQSQPHSVNFVATSNSQLKDVTVTNSPMFHVTLLDLSNFNITNLKVDSPEESPNTDGLHTQSVENVSIRNSYFRSGDDCVSVGNSSFHVYINDCHCGPGHGISIGSLGELGNRAEVKEIHVQRVNFFGTMNGVRIKTWHGGQGECHSISFKHSNFTNVMNPLLIDQHYFAESANETSAVKISNITYENLHGTTNILTPSAINLGCSRLVSCTGLYFNNIFFTPARNSVKLKSTCINAKGKTWGRIEPPLSCLNH
ncbi:polygalacturonase QRT2-like [Papaver somniferum]|uniref:polygalacturonase QRT2-like n=1 Tax=Papaver somniferum TaxID=3469 RepID=UPI000E7048EC|nr:polygalacturonase QRT2-like [Papaver somniferum]